MYCYHPGRHYEEWELAKSHGVEIFINFSELHFGASLLLTMEWKPRKSKECNFKFTVFSQMLQALKLFFVTKTLCTMHYTLTSLMTAPVEENQDKSYLNDHAAIFDWKMQRLWLFNAGYSIFQIKKSWNKLWKLNHFQRQIDLLARIGFRRRIRF